MRFPAASVFAVQLAVVAQAAAGVIELREKNEWLAAVGDFTTVDFTGFPHGTFITVQYAGVGVVFTEGNDSIFFNPTFLNDEWGLDGNGDIAVAFNKPQSWLAVDYAGGFGIDLFSQGRLIDSRVISTSGKGLFVGILSTEPFDVVVLVDVFGNEVGIDDLHFGPAPCLADLDGDGNVGIIDFLSLLAVWGTDPQGPPDFDGDGNVGITDFLELLADWGLCLPDCNGNGVWDLIDLENGTNQDCNDNAIPDACDLADGTIQDCNGNSIPDECDLADGTSEDCNGNGIPDECDLPNDCCEGAIVISDGPTPFLTLDASTGGPPAIKCEDAVVPFVNDIWFLYTASCTGFATFSLCNDADFDTRLAVYYAGSCPPSLNPLVCSDNAPGCGQTSEVQQFVGEGISYLVRVGGTEGGGVGTLTVSCGSAVLDE